MDRKTLKENAKASLKGKYSDAMLLMLIYGLISGAVVNIFGNVDNLDSLSYYNSFGGVVSFLITCLFIFGLHSYYLKLSRNESVTWKELFNKTDLFAPAIVITLLVAIFTALWTILFIIPGIIAAIGYSQVYFIKLDNPDMEAKDALNKSKELMNGHKMDYFVLMLSFIGWAILSILTLGILYLWLVPYMSVTFANFYNELIKAKK